jgi:hypothetical protein
MLSQLHELRGQLKLVIGIMHYFNVFYAVFPDSQKFILIFARKLKFFLFVFPDILYGNFKRLIFIISILILNNEKFHDSEYIVQI